MMVEIQILFKYHGNKYGIRFMNFFKCFCNILKKKKINTYSSITKCKPEVYVSGIRVIEVLLNGLTIEHSSIRDATSGHVYKIVNGQLCILNILKKWVPSLLHFNDLVNGDFYMIVNG